VLEFVPLIPLLAIVAVSWQLIVADFSEHRLPNKYTVTLIVVTVASLSGYAIATHEYSRLSQTLIAMALTFGIGWLLARYADLGMGDVKLLVTLNGWLAWSDPWLVALSLVVGLLAANIFAVAVWIKRKDPKEHIALGPFLLLGFYVIAITPGWQIFTAAVSSLA
jgi:Flp pilus assembly protein protease CpaA